MKIQELIAEIRKSLTAEELAKVSSSLSNVEREYLDTVDNLKSANAESKGRKEKIREMTAEIEELKDLTTSVDKLKTQIVELSEYKKQLDTIKAKEFETTKTKWEEKSKLLIVPEDNKQFQTMQRLRTKFVFPEEGKELEAKQIEQNLQAFELLETAGVFSSGFAPNTPPKSGGEKVVKDPLDKD